MCIRILHVVTYMGRGGLETMLMNYYRHMDRSKVQFDFLVHREFEADYDEEIRELGGKIYRVSRLIPWSSSYRKQLKKFFMEHPEYRIVHVHQDCLSSVALQCAKECGVPVRIAHSHNSNQDKNWKYLVKRYYMRQIPEYATELFACGKAAGDWMFAGKEYRVLHNAIDCRDYCGAENKSSREELIIGHVGRFNEQKNHGFLIDIFAECVKKNEGIKLWLIGDGDGREKIHQKVTELGLEEKVVFWGIRSDVNELMKQMDVFVFPSLYEGLPVTMIEAQAAGLPCVISDHVSEETIVTTDLVTIKKLSDTPEQWAEHILERGRLPHKDTIVEMQKAGYDIHAAAKVLEEYYLEKHGEK